jgi:hypothetical protein
MMKLWCLCRANPEATRQDVLELCNRINDRLIMVRASYSEGAQAPVVVFDWYTDTQAGVTGEAIVDETRRFVNIFPAIWPLDTENILE